ncbi:MAG TPA: hypothetical protein VGH96_15910 [Streptosporangiaceae bacterium]
MNDVVLVRPSVAELAAAANGQTAVVSIAVAQVANSPRSGVNRCTCGQ